MPEPGDTAAQLHHTVDDLLLGNSPLEWLSAIAIGLGTLVIIHLIKRFALHHLQRAAARSTTRIDDAIVEGLQSTRLWLMLFPALALASNGLEHLPPKTLSLIHVAGTVALFVQAGQWLSAISTAMLRHSRQRALETGSSVASSLTVLSFVVRVVIWAIILLLTLDNLGVDVTALVAGLGVGGLAVALAVQNILGDLFASLSIIADKPFEVGDFIVIGDYSGTVENIGLKTTRLRSLNGEQIIIANSDLLGSRVRNYKRMDERRVVLRFGVLYQTTVDELKKIPELVKSAVESVELVRFERAHLSGFGESSLDFEVVYWMKTADYNAYMDAQQHVNLTLFEVFARQGIGFAYPTRTVILDHGTNPATQKPTDVGTAR